MITGLLFTLAQKPLVVANDSGAEGRPFPRSAMEKAKKAKARAGTLVAVATTISLVFAIAGAALLAGASSTWFFDPASGLHIQTAGLNFTLSLGVAS
jgi:hypothetical protein